MRTLLLAVPATAYMVAGLLGATLLYLDTVSGRYPWADHMPICAVLVGCIAATLHILGVALAYPYPRRDARGRYTR